MSIPQGAYFELRNYTLGAQTSFETVCALLNIKLDIHTRKSPLIKSMIRLGVKILCILNDIISLPKELNESNAENLIFSKLNEYSKIDPSSDQVALLKSAFDYVVDLYNRKMIKLIALQERIQSLDPSEQDAVKAYYNIIMELIRDNLDWYFIETKRYKLPNMKFEEHEINSNSTAQPKANTTVSNKTAALIRTNASLFHRASRGPVEEVPNSRISDWAMHSKSFSLTAIQAR